MERLMSEDQRLRIENAALRQENQALRNRLLGNDGQMGSRSDNPL